MIRANELFLENEYAEPDYILCTMTTTSLLILVRMHHFRSPIFPGSIGIRKIWNFVALQPSLKY